MHKKWGYQNLSSAKDLMPSFAIQEKKYLGYTNNGGGSR
jgi:hypothetical protein